MTFTVDYPERLSRGLVLVKWWLLALPHYLVVAVFAGGWAFAGTNGWRSAGGGGLIALLADPGSVSTPPPTPAPITEAAGFRPTGIG